MKVTYEVLNEYGKSDRTEEAELINIMYVNGETVASLLLKDGSFKFVKTEFVKGPTSNERESIGHVGVDAPTANTGDSDNRTTRRSDSTNETATLAVRGEEKTSSRGALSGRGSRK